ncbi:MAG: transglycosylase SLT domain-containing protein [Betaproteobacteria bacterium]|nr:transglycosylase SLT domain-containing protein [Betaproteobacteria bacterium]
MNTTASWRGLQQRAGIFLARLYNGLAFLGTGALVFLLAQGNLLTTEPAARGSAAFGSITYESVAGLGAGDEAHDPKYHAIASYLSKKYKVATDATVQLVGAAYDAGNRVGVDPLLILAVMAIESKFNPIAESVAGAKGLMQVIPRHHQDKFSEHGGEEAVLDPTTNIQVGARILKDYIRRTGNLEAGLQLYGGALSDASGQYAQKVIAEKERLRQALQRLEKQPAKSPA